LRTALTDRVQRNREARARFNAWRVERGYKPVPDFAGPYTDHLQPMVLLALHTGLRRGELLALCWRDVDLPETMLTVRGSDAKTGKTRYVPLNSEAANVLRAWRPEEADQGALVFPGHDGRRMKTITTAWRAVAKEAKLTGFNFHDLRHHAGSRLMPGRRIA
jgi:integrase